MSVPQTVYEWIDSWAETKSAPGRMLPLLREAFEAGRLAGGAEKQHSRFVHIAYGLRKDGAIGPAADGMPVLSHVVFDAHETDLKGKWHWSDGSISDWRPSHQM